MFNKSNKKLRNYFIDQQYDVSENFIVYILQLTFHTVFLFLFPPFHEVNFIVKYSTPYARKFVRMGVGWQTLYISSLVLFGKTNCEFMILIYF